jgi:Raf kinase inhibitor-like YbhB/YbcL family protein
MIQTISNMHIDSEAFKDGGEIPAEYTCDGENINPPLSIDELPDETKSLAIIMEDPDTGHGTFDHWVAWNIPPTREIQRDFQACTQGRNSNRGFGYFGPCPPSGKHRYFFKIYAVDEILDLDEDAGKHELLDEIKGHIVGGGEIMGHYKR